MPFAIEKFGSISLQDPFFTSLKQDYGEFSEWFQRKKDSSAFVYRNDSGIIEGFLYMKRESDALSDIAPPRPPANRLKVGTFKIDAHGTRLGERFVKKIFDCAFSINAEEVYLTIFAKHEQLMSLLTTYGFAPVGEKVTANGKEYVLLKVLTEVKGNSLLDYPIISPTGHNKWLLSIYPDYHTRLFPDSILQTESSSIVKDVSPTNSIHKIYLAKMDGMPSIKQGDVLVIYRTKEKGRSGYYTSVASTLCVVEEFRDIRSFSSLQEFLQYSSSYSIFSVGELTDMWRTKKYPYIVKFLYNVSLSHRLNRKELLEKVGLDENSYFGFMCITDEQFRKICSIGKVNGRLIIN
jgi:hypothetical protein